MKTKNRLLPSGMRRALAFIILFCCLGIGARAACITMTLTSGASSGSVSNSICAGGTATVAYSCAGSATWATSNPAVASVNPTTGTITTSSTVTTATLVNISYGSLSAKPITVNPLPNAGTI